MCNGQDDDCCTPENPCNYLDGDCDENEDCDLGFLCGTDNCQGPGFDATDDCCDFGKMDIYSEIHSTSKIICCNS